MCTSWSVYCLEFSTRLSLSPSDVAMLDFVLSSLMIWSIWSLVPYVLSLCSLSSFKFRWLNFMSCSSADKSRQRAGISLSYAAAYLREPISFVMAYVHQFLVFSELLWMPFSSLVVTFVFWLSTYVLVSSSICSHMLLLYFSTCSSMFLQPLSTSWSTGT